MVTELAQANSNAHRRSHSQLNDYLHCSWAFRLKRIKKVPERGSVWLPGGKAFHSVTEGFDRQTWQENDLSGLDPEPWENAFEDEFERELDELRENDPDESSWRTAGRKTIAKPNGEDVTWWRTAGRQFVSGYIAWRTSTADTLRIATVEGGPGIEVEVEMPLGGVPMRGYVDRLMEDTSTGELLLMDLKSGSRTPVSPMQLALYSVQLEPRVGRPIVWGAYFDARKGTLTDPISLTNFTEHKLGIAYQNLDRAVTAGIFLPTIDSHCKACGVRSACIWTGGTEPTTPVEVQ